MFLNLTPSPSALFVFPISKGNKESNQSESVSMQACQHESRTLRITALAHEKYPHCASDADQELSDLRLGQVASRLDFRRWTDRLDEKVSIH